MTTFIWVSLKIMGMFLALLVVASLLAIWVYLDDGQ